MYRLLSPLFSFLKFSSQFHDHTCHLLLQVPNGLVLPDKASLYLTAIEDADYKEDKIECELILFPRVL